MGAVIRARLGSWGLLLGALFALLLSVSHAGQAWAQSEGILKVNANVVGADVYVDGERVGETPLIHGLPPGTYTLEIKAENHDSYTHRFEMESDKAVALEAILESRVGTLIVQCNIDGASVFVDGKEVGKTPDLEVGGLLDGDHDVRIEAPGHLGYSARVVVPKNSRKELSVELTVNAAKLSVLGLAEGATVEVDGEVVGEIPLEAHVISGGRHHLKVSQDGYATYIRAFQVRIGEHYESHPKMVEKGGAIKVKANKKNAVVYLEGVPMGQAPLKVDNLAPGTYAVRVGKEGYVQQVLKVDVSAKRTTGVKADLISEDAYAKSANDKVSQSEPKDRRWLWAVAGGVVAASAGGAGYYYYSQQSSGTGGYTPGDVAIQLP